MKDYSKYFQNIESKGIDSSYGYITKLEVVGDEVHVWTAQTKKSEPLKYSILELPYFLEKLEKQYQTIIDNKEIIKKDYIRPKQVRIIFTFLTIIIALITKGTSLLFADALQLGISLIVGTLTLGIGGMFTCFNKIEEKFEQELAIYKDFLEKRNDIERQAKTDKNITENLSRSTTKTITTKTLAKDNGITNQIYDIDFMDKVSLRQLKKIIENYNQSKSLFEEQNFVSPTKTQTKTRTLKK